MKTEKSNLNRRDFLKGMAIVTSAGALAGCAPKIVDPTEQPASASHSVTAGPVDWLGEEPVIDKITDTIERDVIVIGAGTGGAYVAASCLEKGLDVLLIEKNDTIGDVRNDFGAFNSKWQQEEGVELDKAVMLRYHMQQCANRIDARLTRIWIEESGDAVNWIGELFENKGAKMHLEGGFEPDFSPASFPKFPIGHSAEFFDGMSGAIIMKEYIEELGGEYQFNTSFVKFELESKKVTAAIGKNQNGEYIRFVGKKGIVLSTGGYQGDPNMLMARQPENVMISTPPMPTPNSGDGIKACLWMGAAMDEVTASSLFDRMALLPNETPATMTRPSFFWLGSQPWLKVNLLGERFTNESAYYDYILHAAAKQPGATYCCIMDSNWFEQVTQFSTIGCSRIYPFPNGSPNDVYKKNGLGYTGTDMVAIEEEWTEIMEGLVESGHLQKADTPEQLAEKLNIPASTFTATFNRYNELAQKGEDEDFFKESYRLLPLTKPPFYGIRTTGWLLCTMDGIRIDTKMRPVDSMNEPFEGLHVIGDASGSFFAYSYPSLFTGFANGRTLTFARRVARVLAGETEAL